LGLGGVALGFAGVAALLALVLPNQEFLSAPYFFLLALAAIIGFFVYGRAVAPARRFQQSLRDRLFPVIFGFVDNLSYRNGVTPESYGRLPLGAVGRHNRRRFDDVVTGTHDGFAVELFEASLRNKSGKSESK